MIDFAQVQRSVITLKNQLADHQIDETGFENQLLEMIDLAEDGHYWMFGHQTEQWYRYDGEKWQPANPETIIDLRRKTGSVAVFSSNGVTPAPENTGIQWLWFIVSLGLIMSIGSIVYNTV